MKKHTTAQIDSVGGCAMKWTQVMRYLKRTRAQGGSRGKRSVTLPHESNGSLKFVVPLVRVV